MFWAVSFDHPKASITFKSEYCPRVSRSRRASPYLHTQLPSLSPCLRFKKSKPGRKVSAGSVGLIAGSLLESTGTRRVYSSRDSSTPIASAQCLGSYRHAMGAPVDLCWICVSVVLRVISMMRWRFYESAGISEWYAIQSSRVNSWLQRWIKIAQCTLEKHCASYLKGKFLNLFEKFYIFLDYWRYSFVPFQSGKR